MLFLKLTRYWFKPTSPRPTFSPLTLFLETIAVSL